MKRKRNRDSNILLAESEQHLLLLSIRLILGTLTFSPVLHGCNRPAQDGSFIMAENAMVKLAVLNEDDSIKCIDALVFNDDMTMILDSYQRMPYNGNSDLKIGSTLGNKVLFICANPQWESTQWHYIHSAAGLAKTKANLEYERRDAPLMTGIHRFEAGGVQTESVRLSRLMCEIHLGSVSYDFSDKPYDGEKIENMKAYLINVNATCSITTDEETRPERILNQGFLQPDDIRNFTETDMIVQDIVTDIGDEMTPVGISLMCYPNSCDQESIGAPCTRLVIEGDIDGDRWYWPVNVRPERNCRYSYDIRITGKGSANPDIPVNAEAMEVTIDVKRWEEKEEYSVRF